MSDAHAPLETLPRSLNILLGAALLALSCTVTPPPAPPAAVIFNAPSD